MTIKVLIVEEERLVEGVAARFLDRGCRVSLARGVPQALEALRKEPYDLAFVDAGMGVQLTDKADALAGARLVLTAGGEGSGIAVEHRALQPKDYLDLAAETKRAGQPLYMDEALDPDSHLTRLLESAGHRVLRKEPDADGVRFAFLGAGAEGWRMWSRLRLAGGRAVMPAGPCAQHVAGCFARGEAPVVGKSLGANDMDGLVVSCLKASSRLGAAILLVDDDNAFRESIGDLLAAEGFSVDQASSATMGLDRASKKDYDVIVSDYHMPDFSGVEMVERLRDRGQSTRVIFLTGEADLDSAVQAVHMSAQDYLSKPVEPEALLAAVQRALQGRRLEGQVKGLLRELCDANGRLESFDRMKSRFLFLVAHDIRSPLAGAKGFADYLLLKNPDLAPLVKDGLQMIGHAVLQVDRLVEDLMDLGRMESGKLTVKPEPVDMKKMSGELKARFEMLAREAEIELSFDAAAAPSEIVADPIRIDQVISNLAGNALKHVGRGKHVSVALSTGTDGGLAVDVVDDGPGLLPEQLTRVFEAFYQGDDPMALKKGMGLGLAIVKEIVEAHGGRVWVESKGMGMGCAFRIRLPAAPPAEKTAS